MSIQGLPQADQVAAQNQAAANPPAQRPAPHMQGLANGASAISSDLSSCESIWQSLGTCFSSIGNFFSSLLQGLLQFFQSFFGGRREPAAHNPPRVQGLAVALIPAPPIQLPQAQPANPPAQAVQIQAAARIPAPPVQLPQPEVRIALPASPFDLFNENITNWFQTENFFDQSILPLPYAVDTIVKTYKDGKCIGEKKSATSCQRVGYQFQDLQNAFEEIRRGKQPLAKIGILLAITSLRPDGKTYNLSIIDQTFQIEDGAVITGGGITPFNDGLSEKGIQDRVVSFIRTQLDGLPPLGQNI